MASHHVHAPRRDDGGDAARPRRRRIAVMPVAAIAFVAVCGVAAVDAAERFFGVTLWPSATAASSQTPGAGATDAGTGAVDAGATVALPIARSATDYNADGVDDTTAIVDGARRDAEAVPAYDDGYYAGGYPPEDRGACTDLVWRAFREAGYDLKAMVDADVAAHPQAYRAVSASPDPNIDFRRTGVLETFFRRYAQSLTTDVADRAQWQPGDVVTFETTRHIAVVSDRASRATGTPYLLHNMGDPVRDNDYLDAPGRMAVTGHFRFDASKVPSDVLRAWKE